MFKQISEALLTRVTDYRYYNAMMTQKRKKIIAPLPKLICKFFFNHKLTLTILGAYQLIGIEGNLDDILMVGRTHLLLLTGGWVGTLLMSAAMSGRSFCRLACFFFSSSSNLHSRKGSSIILTYRSILSQPICSLSLKSISHI